jgi:CDP-diacylglycerol--glycerol-3-phosphate 3-phosphatidyltransferase
VTAKNVKLRAIFAELPLIFDFWQPRPTVRTFSITETIVPDCIFTSLLFLIPSAMNLPNLITFSRLLGVPFLLYGLYEPSAQSRWICTAIFVVAAATDWLDGYLARKLNQITDLGKFLDPLVDKLLVLAPLLVLIELGKVPAWAVFLILGRELTIAGWRVNKTTISGANIWGKLKTVSQIVAIALLIAPVSEAWNVPALIAFWVSVALTLISGAIYLWPEKTAELDKA